MYLTVVEQNNSQVGQLLLLVAHPDSRRRIMLCVIAIIITDQEYPVRPAFSLLTKILDEFIAKVPQSAFSNPSAISFPDIQTYLTKYQDPRQADTIMRVQQELDETKIVLVRLD